MCIYMEREREMCTHIYKYIYYIHIYEYIAYCLLPIAYCLFDSCLLPMAYCP